MNNNMNISVKLKNIRKTYKLYKKNTDRIKEVFLRKKLHIDFHALNGIDFEVGNNEAIAIIGQNGAGKSTLLKILTGVLSPTTGDLYINGRVAAILELGAGFNPENTGLENVKFNCMLMGLKKNEIEDKLKEIIDFADIGEHIYQPVKTYSSGMIARLAFATAVNVDPDILIIDEALSVGDMYFQAKSISKMKEIMKNKTVFFVSHNMDTVRSLCKRAIYIKDGKVFMDDEVKKVTEVYETDNNKRIAKLKKEQSLAKIIENKNQVIDKNRENMELEEFKDEEFEKRVSDFRSGTGELRFIRSDLYIDGKKSLKVPFGSKCHLKLFIECTKDIEEGATIGYTIRNKNGLDIFGLNIYNQSQLLPSLKKGELIEIDINFQNKLSPDLGYSIGLGLKPSLHHPSFYDAIYSALIFDVPTLEEENWVPGVVYLDQEMKYKILKV